MTSQRRGSSWGFRLLALVVGGLALGVTAELVLRLADVRVDPGAKRALHELRPDRPWLYGLRPGYRGTLPATGDVVYAVNAQGFRDRPYDRQRRAGGSRIVVLGSSITFAWGVPAEQGYTSRLEDLLAHREDEPVEVLNLGVNGYNAYNQEALLADRGLDYRPDLVLVEFNTGGLHDPALNFDLQTRLHLGMIPAEAFPDPSLRRPPPRFGGLLRLCRSLRTCSLVDDWLLVREGTEPGLRDLGKLDRVVDLFAGPEGPWLRARYGKMERLAASAGARFGVVAFPDIRQVQGSDAGRMQEQLVALGEEAGWPVLNLVPVFVGAARDGSPPLLLDPWHPTPEGHALAARAIADWLEEQGLLGAAPPALRPR